MSPRSKKPGSFKKNIAPAVNPDVAGLDIGATTVYAAVPVERDQRPIRCFGTFTEDLIALAEWLKSCQIKSVAMESTGVYWIPVFQILEDRGFEVCLVNARHVKNVPGRKTDVLDSQWLQYLHSVGLLRGSFRPPQHVCAVRSLIRHRDSLVKLSSVHIQHMEKSMTQMNLQLHHVLADITGVTGLSIIDAILAGQRDPETLAAYRNPRVKASPETVMKSLVGDYRAEHLFTLQQSLHSYRHYQGLIAECDQKVQSLLKTFDSQTTAPLQDNPKIVKRQQKDPHFSMRSELFRITGVDLTTVPGVQITTVYTLLAEVGHDMSKFPSSKHFASWLGLCPDNRISGGRLLSSHTRPTKSRAATALRMAAQALYRSQTALGDYLRRTRAKLGMAEAITATAHKLARIIYHMLKTKMPYDETRSAHHQENYRRRLEVKVKQQAKTLGFTLVPLPVS